MRILGIDIGSTSIKAVETDSAFGRYEIHDHHEQPIPFGSKAEDVLAQLITSLPRAPDKIVVALPSGRTTFRTLQLPTKDKKAIQAGIGFELEDELPFPLDESVFDYTLTQQTKNSSTVHVGVTLKNHLNAAIENWQKGKTDPDIVTTEPWAYRIHLNRVLGPNGQETPVLLVQIGHDRTTLYVQHRGAPVMSKELRWGGKDLTQAIAKKFEIPLEQAEKAKLDHGVLSEQSDATQDQKEFSTCLEAPLQSLLREIQQVGLICKSITKKNLELIFISGGTAQLPGLAEWLQAALNITTKPLLALSSITTSGVTYSEQTDARFLLAAALTLCQVGADRSQCISFRKGDFAKEAKKRRMNFRALKKPLIGVAIVSFCLFLSLIVQSMVYRSRLGVTDTQLEKSIKSFFGPIPPSVLRGYLAQTSNLRSSINKELNKQRELARLFSPNNHSPLSYLNGLSNAIPKDVVVDMIHFQVGGAPTDPYASIDQNPSASFAFLTSNPQTAEKLANIMSSKLQDVQRGKTEEVIASEEDGTKKWKITFSGKPNEDTYAK